MLGRRWVGWMLVAASVTACGVSEKDARDLLKGANGVAGVDSTMAFRLLYASCGEISSCADGCERGLQFASTTDDESEQGAVLSQCFKDLAEKHKTSGMSVGTWFVGYYRAYAKKASAKLSPEEAKSLQADLVKIGLNAPPGHALRALLDPI